MANITWFHADFRLLLCYVNHKKHFFLSLLFPFSKFHFWWGRDAPMIFSCVQPSDQPSTPQISSCVHISSSFFFSTLKPSSKKKKFIFHLSNSISSPVLFKFCWTIITSREKKNCLIITTSCWYNRKKRNRQNAPCD